jgi:DNA-binding PadR family transcriptional regulator
MTDDVMNNEMRKGFLKMIILKMINDTPMHGYDIIHKIEENTHGRWEPSPGSVYPALEFLMSKGYVSMEEIDRKKMYSITPEGKEVILRLKKRRQEMMEEFNNLLGDLQEKKP